MLDYIKNLLNLPDNDIYIVEDKDNLLSITEIAEYINDNGYKVLSIDDIDIFRYYFETNIRPLIDNGQKEKLIIVNVIQDNKIPFDIYKIGKVINLNLKNIFEKLDISAIKQLNINEIKNLFIYYQNYSGPHLSKSKTYDFILEKLYGIYIQNIININNLVKKLLEIYYSERDLPDELLNYIKSKINIKGNLNKLLSGKEVFFDYLQQQWKCYINDYINKTHNSEIIFDEPEIRVYIDNLFIDGFLYKVDIDNNLLPKWMYCGINYNENIQIQDEINLLINKLENFISKKENINYIDWMHISKLYAKYLVLSDNINNYNYSLSKIENFFEDWVINNYSTLNAISYTNMPVMVHKIPLYIAYKARKGNIDKIALLVFDGMSMDDWLIIKNTLKDEKSIDIIIDEMQSFAWIPTITSISRQAIFSGQIPIYFEKSMLTTEKEPRYWRNFWVDQGFYESDISYNKNIFDFTEEEIYKDIKENKKILGYVINAIDKIMHGQKLSIKGMHQDIKLWLKNSAFLNYLKVLIDNNYNIYITSDHGHTQAMGQGRPHEGVLVESAGERVRFYEKGISNDIKGSIKWNGFGLPNNYDIFICEGKSSYVNNGEKTISHGGISLEEVIVPFINIRKV